MILLTFSETIDASTLNISMITIQSSINLLTDSQFKQFYSLMDSTYLVENSNFIVIILSFSDSNNIKSLSKLAIDEDSTFLSAASILVRDMSGVISKEIFNYSALQVSSFVRDITRPVISQAIFNLTSETVTIYMSETVRANSVNLTQFNLHSSAGRSFSLTGGIVSTIDAPIFTFILRTQDLNVIKQDINFATNITNVFLSFSEYFLLDMSDNPIVPINGSNPMTFSEFISDNIPPTLDSFIIDLDSGTISLMFSETVKAITLFSCTILLSDPTFSIILPLSNYTIYPLSDSHQIQFNLSINDLNSFKSSLIDTLYIFLFIENCKISDMNLNVINPITQGSALISTQIYLDITSPQLLSFNLNLNTSQVNNTVNSRYNYNQVGYNETPVITLLFPNMFQLIDLPLVITNSVYNEVKLRSRALRYNESLLYIYGLFYLQAL